MSWREKQSPDTFKICLSSNDAVLSELDDIMYQKRSPGRCLSSI